MRKRVMVADDDGAIRDSLKKLLEQTGYEVLLATDGEDALKKLDRKAPDLLVLDLEMPKRDGWDVLDWAGGRHAVIPIIVITGRAHELETRMIPGLGALFEKPVDAELLLQKISELLAAASGKRSPKTSEGSGAPALR